MMLNSQLEAIDIDLHPEAAKRAKQYVVEFATTLLLQAKLIAFRAKADVVLSNHIDEALDLITRDKRKTWSRELLIILGSAFFLGLSFRGLFRNYPQARPRLLLYILSWVSLGCLWFFLG